MQICFHLLRIAYLIDMNFKTVSNLYFSRWWSFVDCICSSMQTKYIMRISFKCASVVKRGDNRVGYFSLIFCTELVLFIIILLYFKSERLAW